MTAEARVQHTKTFKRYKAEHRPDLLAAVRKYVATRGELVAYQDASILKVTGTKADIETMLTTLRAEFGALPGDDVKKA